MANQPPPTSARMLAFPPDQDKARISKYEHYDMLLSGSHYAAYNIVMENQLNERFGQLRYISANFPGLISKVIADMLFSEPVKVHFQDQAAQVFAESVMFENTMHVQNYESALSNSGRGDSLYKVRVGKRNPNDDHDSVIIEDISPYIYFPHLDQGNMRQRPQTEELAWVLCVATNHFVRKEIHTAGMVENQIWSFDKNSNKLIAKLPWQSMYPDIPEFQETRVNRSLIVHVPNWKIGTDYFGRSDYADLESIFFALNNRITKIDGILDKHSDPILAVPEGVLDEMGRIRKENLGVFEVTTGSEGGLDKPEYIVWNANLDSAFTEIDKLVEFAFMFSEISPATMGMDKGGQADSGRALKLKLLRTIAKKRRKQLYYDQALKQVLMLAQDLAKAWGLKAYGKDGKAVSPPSDMETPELEFSDGIVDDTREMAEEEQIRLQSGTTSVKDAIMRLDGIDEKAAEKKVKEIEDESGLALPLTQPVSGQSSASQANGSNPASPEYAQPPQGGN